MTIQFSVPVRNARSNAIEATVGANAVLKLYDLTAGAPADCVAAISGVVLATMALESDWMNPASNGTVTKAGTWACPAAEGAGNADFFRLFASDGITCHIQGTVGLGTGDISMDNNNIALGQQMSIAGFSITDNNA